MDFIQGEGRSQGSLFPVAPDDLIPVDPMCRVIDAFVSGLALSGLASSALKLRRQDKVATKLSSRRRSRTDAMLALTLADFGIVRYEAAFCI
jgi:hypothetical protein